MPLAQPLIASQLTPCTAVHRHAPVPWMPQSHAPSDVQLHLFAHVGPQRPGSQPCTDFVPTPSSISPETRIISGKEKGLAHTPAETGRSMLWPKNQKVDQSSRGRGMPGNPRACPTVSLCPNHIRAVVYPNHILPMGRIKTPGQWCLLVRPDRGIYLTTSQRVLHVSRLQHPRAGQHSVRQRR